MRLEDIDPSDQEVEGKIELTCKSLVLAGSRMTWVDVITSLKFPHRYNYDVSVVKSSKVGSFSIAVVIPTRNRPDYLEDILFDIDSQSVPPKIIIVVDSSDVSFKPQKRYKNLEIIPTNIRSAAVQRNIGLDYLRNLEMKVDFVAFLDDDIRIDSDYLENLSQLLLDKAEVIGTSGLALSTNETISRKNRLLNWIGYSGKEGELTKAAINIPVRNQSEVMEVEWLIGCSIWRLSKLETIRFQSDFTGQSIFEDVIFSVEASRIGKLFVDPKVKIHHLLAQENRPRSYLHYSSWVRNRFRLIRVEPGKISIWRFVLVNLLVAGKLLLNGNVVGTSGIIVAMASLSLRK
jgi:glycosyltransferase involved in cell wall biosynthesis